MPERANRIDARFAALRASRQKAFVAYIAAGDPGLTYTVRLVHALELAGVDVLELGVPFSDPLADGVVNQLAADRALRSGTTLRKVLDAVARLRRGGVKMPLVLFTYFNPIHRYGVARFARDAVKAGVDGVLNLDLPPEEAGAYAAAMDRAGLRVIYLVAPTSDHARIRAIARKAKGFIYYVSREGVTGMRKNLARGIETRIQKIRKHTRTPIVVGFGISTPDQVLQAAAFADGVVVGSAIVARIGRLGRKATMVPGVARFVRSLVRPLRG